MIVRRLLSLILVRKEHPCLLMKNGQQNVILALSMQIRQEISNEVIDLLLSDGRDQSFHFFM